MSAAPTDTLCLALSGRAWAWPRTRAFLERQLFDHAGLHLIVLDTSHDTAFNKEISTWVHGCDYEKKTYVHTIVGRAGIADLPRNDYEKEVCAVCVKIYNTFVALADGQTVFFLEDDVIPPDDAYVRLKQLLTPGIATVSGHYLQRHSKPYESIEWDWTEHGKIHYTGRTGVSGIGGNGFGCVAIHGQLLGSTEFRAGPDWQNYDHNFYADLRDKGGKALIDWDCRCRHYLSAEEWI